MYLRWLRNGFTPGIFSWLFDIPKSTVSSYFVTRTNLLYFSLGKIVIWPSKVQLLDSIPEKFKTSYPSSRCIIGCTSIFYQRPFSLLSQNAMHSNYKHHVAYKRLLGIVRSVAITFISNLCDGSMSDKDIVKRSGILNKNPWDDIDSIMDDKSFAIQNELALLNVKLNIPSFLGGRAQLNESEVKENQTIVSVLIHVERAITRIKKFKALNHIPLTLHGSVNQIWVVS